MCRLIAAAFLFTSAAAIAQPALPRKQSVTPQVQPAPERPRAAAEVPGLTYEAYQRQMTLQIRAKRLEEIRILERLLQLQREI